MKTLQFGFVRHVLVPLTAWLSIQVAAAATVYEIGTLPGKLRFDVELLEVSPNTEVQLRLRNTDEMQHNLIICSPGEGVAMKVAQKAWLLGAQAVEKQYVPELPEVLFYTKVVNPGGEDTISIYDAQNTGGLPLRLHHSRACLLDEGSDASDRNAFSASVGASCR